MAMLKIREKTQKQHETQQLFPLEQRFSSFLMLQTFKTVPHVVMTPNHKIFIAIS